MSTSITVQDVPHPLPESGNITDFITPDWHELVEFYPEYCRKVVEAGGVPYDPQPWALTVCKELVRLGVREGRTVDEWMQRAIEHFGLQWFAGRFKTMKQARAKAMKG